MSVFPQILYTSLKHTEGGLVMKTVKVDLENCYGIKKLKHTFDFEKSAYALYAPNGVMKSSLAKTFDDAAKGVPSKDRIFPARATIRSIKDEKSNEIERERVLVVLPYDEKFGISERTSTLLLDANLKKEYEALLQGVDQARDVLLNAIKTQSGPKIDFGAEISTAFMATPNEFAGALHRIRKELDEQKDAPYAAVEYATVFNEKVTGALNTKNLKNLIADFVTRYNELLDKSKYFQKGVFDYYHAGQIAKSLADNGFFTAKHTVSLRSLGEDCEITTQAELEAVIGAEKAEMLKDKALKKMFDEVSKQLDRNAELRAFRTYLQSNEPLLARMDNPEKFKQDVLKSFIKTHDDLYRDWLAKDEKATEGRKRIEEEAEKQKSQWEKVIEIFNDRFFVPFKLDVKNKIQVTVGATSIIELGFVYQEDGGDKVEVQIDALREVLSTGERKALYVLNVIFEIETRIKNNTETLVIVDDIADSFDYQNKYAIIEYLKEISENPLFKLVIMTHNFDFFRTLESRLGGAICLMASKNKTDTTLTEATGVRNVFSTWKKNFFADDKIKIATVPFLRNLIEMTAGTTDPNYKTLTSLLHVKVGSDAITIGDLDAIFNSTCKPSGTSTNPKKRIFELLDEQAKACLAVPKGMNLENKIVLAIAVRIEAERFMIKKINDPAFVGSIKSNQTPRLIKRYKSDFSGELNNIAILDQVALMTPENIHVNSFMYEPIIDMADDHLQKLYKRVCALT
jgi:hypothetical protein